MSNTCVQQPVQEKKGFGYSKLKKNTDSTKGFTIQSYQKDVKVCDLLYFLKYNLVVLINHFIHVAKHVELNLNF